MTTTPPELGVDPWGEQLNTYLADLEAKLEDAGTTPGPEGPAGPAGPKGDEGAEGGAGPAGTAGPGTPFLLLDDDEEVPEGTEAGTIIVRAPIGGRPPT